MTYREALVAWNPGTTQIRIGPLLAPGDPDWTVSPIRYLYTGGAAYEWVRSAAPDALKLRVMVDFHCIVVRDKVPVEAAHRAFLAVDEYRASITPDVPGADPD